MNAAQEAQDDASTLSRLALNAEAKARSTSLPGDYEYAREMHAEAAKAYRVLATTLGNMGACDEAIDAANEEANEHEEMAS